VPIDDVPLGTPTEGRDLPKVRAELASVADRDRHDRIVRSIGGRRGLDQPLQVLANVLFIGGERVDVDRDGPIASTSRTAG
jgi:hypothetical protein